MTAISCYLALLLLVTSASACILNVPECSCELYQHKSIYECDVGGAKFSVEGAYNRYVTIRCQSGNFSSDLMPELALSHGGALFTVSLASCEVPVLSHLLARVGANGVDKLKLINPKGALETRHLAGSTEIRAIIIENIGASAYQHSVPYDVISMLPSLEVFELFGAPLALRPAPRTPLRVLELNTASIQNLDPGLFSNIENLTELHLRGNLIKEIKPGAFDGLSSLQLLDLSSNPLTQLSAGALRGLEQLTHLLLVYDHLRVVHRGAFAGAPRLAEIKLERGRYNLTLEPQALANLQYLKNVSLRATCLNDLPSELFTNSSAIESINLSYCTLTNVPATLLRDQKNLKWLHLTNNRIKMIPIGLFSNLIKLEFLDLSQNSIGHLDENRFAGLTNLFKLDLSINGLKTLADGAFTGLTNLVELKLDGNQLKTLSDGAFTGLVRLRNLDLAFNQVLIIKSHIQEDNQSPFVNLTELRVLNLSSNQIEIIFDDWRKSLYNLEDLHLYGNRVRKLRKKDMEFVSKKITVDLRYNEITTIEISDNLRSSTTLMLENNPYNCDCELYPFLDLVKTHNTEFGLSSAYCETPPHLEAIHLKDVPLTSVSCPISDCPSSCSCSLFPAASSIYLDCKTAPTFYPKPKSYNMTSIKLKLRSLKNNILPILSPEVVSLNLSGIGLIKAPSLLKTLKEVDLSFNQLATIPQAISSLNATLYIAGNLIQCSCKNKDDIEALLNKSNGIADWRNVYCVDGEPLLSVEPSNLCEVWAATLGIFIAAFVFVIAAFVISVFIYSDEIKRYIYMQGWNFFIYEEELDGRKYDVLVSYGDEVEKYVVREFVPELEKRGYTVSARYKDWDIGVWIPTVVAETVGQSRRVVVIPTESYLRSVISMELEAARLAQMGQKRKRLLIVVKDEIEIEPFKEFKCLRWANFYFWEKLEKELPKRRKKSEKIGSQANLNVLMTSEGKIEFARDKAR